MIIIVCELLRATRGMLGWERSKRQSEFLKKKKEKKKLAEKKFGSTYETCKPHHWEERQQH